MSNNFKRCIDRQMWVAVSPTPTAAAAGMGMCSDLRNDISRNPFCYQLGSATVLNRYSIIAKSWLTLSPALAGTFGAGAGCVFAPSFSVLGNIGSECSTTMITTTTNQTDVGVNMLSNRGGSGDYGFLIRIIGNSSGGSGKIEERWIYANSGGVNPTIYLDPTYPLSFTPQAGDTYELLSGKIYMLSAGALATNIFRSYEVAFNTLSSGISTTNLPSTVSTEFSAVALDELYVPYDSLPGEGMILGSAVYDLEGWKEKRCLIASDSGSGTITGNDSTGDYTVLQNEYRNFQIRIVEDTEIPTAVNQRRIIASHTAGPSPVYTLGTNWAVTPSTTAKYVIENPNLIILWSSGSTNTHVYNYTANTINNGTNSISANSWSTTYFGARGNAMGAGCVSFPSFGIRPDIAKYSRHSFIYSFRGGASVALDLLDIAGSITGTWSNTITYDRPTWAPTTGTCGTYAPYDNEGRFGYINFYTNGVVNQIFRFDVRNRVVTQYTATDWVQSGTAAITDRIASYVAIDGTDKYTIILLIMHASTIAFELIVQV